jgi:hypothetical protein
MFFSPSNYKCQHNFKTDINIYYHSSAFALRATFGTREPEMFHRGHKMVMEDACFKLVASYFLVKKRRQGTLANQLTLAKDI